MSTPTTSIAHSALAPADGIHGPHSWAVVDEAQRLALAVTSDDIGKIACQGVGDLMTEWTLVGAAPAVWKERGARGLQGDPGLSAYQVAVAGGYVGSVQTWLASLQGAAGKSAYQVAVDGGYSGTAAQWVTSLIGAAGKSAYQVALDGGFVGSQAAWVASLKGSAGDSAYAVAVANGFSGSQAAWLASLKGADGGSGGTVSVSASRALTIADNGKVVELTATGLTLTMPAGLATSAFACRVISPGANFIASAGGVLLNGLAATVPLGAGTYSVIGKASVADSYVVSSPASGIGVNASGSLQKLFSGGNQTGLAWRTRHLSGATSPGSPEGGIATATLTGTISNNVLTVTNYVGNFTAAISTGMLLFTADTSVTLAPDTLILSVGTATGGTTGTYNLSKTPNIAASTVFYVIQYPQTLGTPGDGVKYTAVPAYLYTSRAFIEYLGRSLHRFHFNNGDRGNPGDSYTVNGYLEVRPAGTLPTAGGNSASPIPGVFQVPITWGGKTTLTVPAGGGWTGETDDIFADMPPGSIGEVKLIMGSAAAPGSPWKMWSTGGATGAGTGLGVATECRNITGYPGSILLSADATMLKEQWGGTRSGGISPWNQIGLGNQAGYWSFSNVSATGGDFGRMPGVDGHGDSIMFSTAGNGASWFERFLHRYYIPNRNYGASGSSISMVPLLFEQRGRDSMADIVWCNHGRNGGLTEAVLYATCRMFRRMGYKRVVWSTITNQTNSSNSAITGDSRALNTMLFRVCGNRDLYPDAPDALVDGAKYVQDANTGLWLDATYTSDYLHPSTLGNSLIDAGLAADGSIAKVLGFTPQ